MNIKDEIVSQFSALPRQEDPRWGIMAREIGGKYEECELTAVYTDTRIKDDIRFGCFYVVQTRLRGHNDYAQFKKNVQKNLNEFKNQPMFSFMRAETYGDVSGDSNSRELAIELARQAVEELPNTPGVHHLLAEYLLESVEIGTLISPGDKEKERLNEAQLMVDSAITLSDGTYGKYFATKGRILSALGSNELALANFDKAILIEDGRDSSGKDKIRSYQAYRREVATKKLAQEVFKENKSAITEFRALRGELLSLLGLLAAVVAFISTSTSIATNFEIEDAILLEISSAGAIIVVFAIFSQLFVRKYRTSQLLLALGTGLVLLALPCVGILLLR